MLTILIVIATLALLILIHELGHFLSAKLAGLRIEEFGFGFPPRLFGKKIGETIYSLNLVPFGGFVKIYGESDRSLPDIPEKERNFAFKSVGVRAIILISGTLNNFIFGWLLLSFIFFIGVPTLADDTNRSQLKDIQITISMVAPNSPADLAGLKPDDKILEIKTSNESLPAKDFNSFLEFIEKHKGEKLVFTILRGKQIFDVEVISRANPPKNEGPTGIALAEIGFSKLPFLKSLTTGLTFSLKIASVILETLGKIIKNLFIGAPVEEIIVGPVGIVGIVNQVTHLGLSYLFRLIAIISLNLAVLNILPFPALDGGRLVFLGIEKIKGSPVSKKVEQIIHATGFAFLILLMVIVTVRDVIRIF